MSAVLSDPSPARADERIVSALLQRGKLKEPDLIHSPLLNVAVAHLV